MRTVVQRVSEASVKVEGNIVGQIKSGLLVLLGVEQADTDQDVIYTAQKISGLRIFEDSEQKMNLSVEDVGGSVLVVSQFTLYGDCRKGRRPSFIQAASPEHANKLYLAFVAELKGLGLKVETGQFQASMSVSLVNEGPVTMLLDSRKLF